VNKYLSNSNFDFQDKFVLVRIDCDVDLREENNQLIVDEPFRLKQTLPTLKFLDKAGVEKIIMIGHMGRPGGKLDDNLSLRPIANWFSKNYKECFLVKQSYSSDGVSRELLRGVTSSLMVLQNLRFHPGERDSDSKFAQQLASLADVYVNEAFGSSHRDHASITGVPQHLPSFLGLNFAEEIKNLTKIKKNAQRPLVIILGGSKKGKIDYISFLADLADTLLIGGKLPKLIQNSEFKIQNLNVDIAQLTSNQRDISQQSIEKFKQEINKAASLFLVGPLGVYEEKENRVGTSEVANAVASSPAFKLAAGGDTHRVLSWLDLWDKFDFVSTGGGAALQFLRDDTLPGIEAI
jgi:3-phosphoglycerate kinase